MIALDRPGLSCRSEQAIRICPKASYFQLSIYRIRQGTDSDFADLVRLRAHSDDVDQSFRSDADQIGAKRRRLSQCEMVIGISQEVGER